MFVRSKRVSRRGGVYHYLQVVESYRDQGKVRQRVIATLGRQDRIIADGRLDDLIRSMARFSTRLRVVESDPVDR